jgi:isocitrate lyase
VRDSSHWGNGKSDPAETPRDDRALVAFDEQVRALEERWAGSRYGGIERRYSARDVVRLRGSVLEDHATARIGAERLWQLITQDDEPVRTFGALTGNQAVQMVRAGLKSIYLSGWQVAGDMNLALQTYPDQSLYPSNSGPTLVRRINNALKRADQIEWSENEGQVRTQWMAPIVADAEAGFGGALHAHELAKSYIEAGAAGIHFEDQLAAEKKCGHMGGKVLVPTSQFINVLSAARLASDVLDVPTVLFARTDAESATLLTSDVDERDQAFLTGARTAEGYYRVRSGLEPAIARALAYAPYADVLWCETKTPDLDEARQFAEAVHDQYPGKLLAYNCSPSFNWKRHLDDATIARFQRELGTMGYRYQFITLAGWHLVNLGAFEMAREYAARDMEAYVRVQEREFHLEEKGYTAVKHQREVGGNYFDLVLDTLSSGEASTGAMKESTESAQFG